MYMEKKDKEDDPNEAIKEYFGAKDKKPEDLL
jgi:hypothetical protein